MERCSSCKHKKVLNSEQIYCTIDGDFTEYNDVCSYYERRVKMSKEQEIAERDHMEEKIRDHFREDERKYREWLDSKAKCIK